MLDELSLKEVQLLGSAICDDLVNYTRPWTNEREPAMQVGGALLITTASVCVTFRSLFEGDVRTAEEWILRPILRSDKEGEYELIAPTRVAGFFADPPILPDGLVTPFLTEWAESLFVYERYRGPIGIAGTETFRRLQPWLAQRLPDNPDLSHVALAAAEWACRRNVDDDVLQAAVLELRNRNDLPPEIEIALEVHLAETASRRGLAPGREAGRVLHTFKRRLTGTQLLRLYGLGATDDPDGTVRNFESVVSLIELVMRDWRSTTPGLQAMADRRGAYFKLIGTFVEALLKAERADLVGDLLGAWLEVDASARRRDLLVWFVTDTPGIGWAGRQEIELRRDLAAVARYVEALSQFTGTVLGISDFEEHEPLPPAGRLGIPNSDFSDELSHAMLDVLSMPQLRQVTQRVALPVRAVVTIPYVGCPWQSVLVRWHGHTWPWSVSLARPLPDRPTRRVRIVVTGADFGEIEAKSTASILEGSGVESDVIDSPDLSSSDFLSLYHDDWPDVFWVIGHAEFAYDNPESSKLLMRDGSAVSAASLQTPPLGDHRRLLVLNVCEAGLSAVNGGLPEIGLAAVAAGPCQAVIGHLWPVASWPDAPLFGRLLASALALDVPFFEAYEHALRMLVAGPTIVGPMLDGATSVLDCRLREAIEGRHGARMSDLAFWASACFLE